MASEVAPEIIEIIQNARVYAEGRGFRIDVRNDAVVESVKKLVLIKAQN